MSWQFLRRTIEFLCLIGVGAEAQFRSNHPKREGFSTLQINGLMPRAKKHTDTSCIRIEKAFEQRDEWK